MKNKITNLVLLAVLSLVSFSLLSAPNVFAEEEVASEEQVTGTSIRLMPTSKIFQIASDSTYDGTMTIKNDGETEIRVEVYAAPYSYVYSDEEDLYKLGFSNENNFTQISRWIKVQDENGEFVEKPVFTIPSGGEIEVTYRITTPSNIPSGGQYAVIFAHTLTSVVSASGIRTEASPGMVVYGRSTEGEAITSAEISDMKIERSVTEAGTVRNNFYASAKIKNTGNVDINATGKLKVEPIIGFGSYETDEKFGYLSVIPEAELVISDEWTETPTFGLYKATWTVSAEGNTETIEKVIFLISPIFIIITISLLTILIVWIIIVVKKRKERRSRLAV